MALIFCDGFDWYLSADLLKRWSDGASMATVGTAYARPPSGQGVAVSGTNVTPLTKTFGSNYTQGCVGFGWYFTNSASSKAGQLTILDGTTEQISIRTNGSGVITVTRNGTVLATGSTVLAQSTWHYVELKFTIHASAGVVEVKLNGASEISSTTSLNTRNTANTQWNGVRFATQNNTGSAASHDDIYVLDTSTGSNTDFLGPVQIVARYPTANGNYSQWTPNGGSNVGAVSEPYQDGNTSFNQSSTANQIDTFEMQNLPASSGSVFAVAHHLVAAQDGGAARTIRPKYRISTTDYNGSNVNTSASYQAFTEYKDVSPATATAWTVSEVNGMETGYELVS